jgi:hypothetical protein
MRNAMPDAGKTQRRVVSAWVGTAFAQDDANAAAAWRQVADQLRPRVSKLAALMDRTEADVLRCGRHLPNEAAVIASSELCCNRMMVGRAARAYASLETIAPLSDNPAVSLPAIAA